MAGNSPMLRQGILWFLISVTCGCGARNPGMGGKRGTLWGPAVQVAALGRFQGKWVFDQERTLAAWKDAGMPQDQIESARAMYEELKHIELPPDLRRALGKQADQVAGTMGRMHPNLTFDGHLAIGDSLPSAEYRLFAIHEHDQTVCAKAWHHEDRNDPGDMSKCYVRLAIIGDELHLKVRDQEETSLTDADLTETAPIVAPAGAACDADAPPGTTWSEWTTYVFVRRAQN